MNGHRKIYRNPKNGDAIESELLLSEAAEILSKKENRTPFENDMIRAARSCKISPAQQYHLIKLAHAASGKAPSASVTSPNRAEVKVGAGFERLSQLFQSALTSKLLNPKLRLMDQTGKNVVLTIGKPESRNPGFIYIKVEGEYCGKISPNGVFSPVANCADSVKTYLQEFSADPLAGAKAYGLKTGNCCCCGRLLTNGLSVELGIGPICREQWGI